MKLWTALLFVIYVAAEISEDEIKSAFMRFNRKLLNGTIHKHSVVDALSNVAEFEEKVVAEDEKYETCSQNEAGKFNDSFSEAGFKQLVRNIESCLGGTSGTSAASPAKGKAEAETSATTTAKNTAESRTSANTPAKGTAGPYVDGGISDQIIKETLWNYNGIRPYGCPRCVSSNSVANVVSLLPGFDVKAHNNDDQFNTCLNTETRRIGKSVFSEPELIQLVRGVEKCLKTEKGNKDPSSGKEQRYIDSDEQGVEDPKFNDEKGKSTDVKVESDCEGYVTIKKPEYGGNLGWTSVHFANMIHKNNLNFNPEENNEVWSPWALEFSLAGFFSDFYKNNLRALQVVTVKLFAADFSTLSRPNCSYFNKIKDHYLMIKNSLKQGVYATLGVYFKESKYSRQQFSYVHPFTATVNQMRTAPQGYKDSRASIILYCSLTLEREWKFEFNEVNETNSKFKEAPKGFLRNTGNYRYLNNEANQFKVIDLPFDDGATSLLIFLPNKETVEGLVDMESQLMNTDWVNGLELTETLVRVTIPKFILNMNFGFEGVVKEALNMDKSEKTQFNDVKKLLKPFLQEFIVVQNQDLTVDELGIVTTNREQEIINVFRQYNKSRMVDGDAIHQNSISNLLSYLSEFEQKAEARDQKYETCLENGIKLHNSYREKEFIELIENIRKCLKGGSESKADQSGDVDFLVNRPFMFAVVHKANSTTVLLQGHWA